MGLMSGLKEFGQNFVLTAGDTIADSIKKRDEQYRKDVLDQYSSLKANIKKNKAVDAKLYNSMLSEAKTLVGLAPNLPDDYIAYGLSSKDNYKQLLKTLQEDSERGKSGFFISEWAAKNNMEPSEIYNPRKRDVSRIVRSLRSPTVTSKKPSAKVTTDTDNTLQTLAGLIFGGATGSDKVMEAAEAKISTKGRGAFGKSDLDYAYSTPTRGISLPDKNVSLKRIMKSNRTQFQAFNNMLPKYLKTAQTLGVLTSTMDETELDPKIVDSDLTRLELAMQDGLDKKIYSIFRTLPSNDLAFTEGKINQVFPITEKMSNDEKQKIRNFKRVLRLDIFDEYRKQLETLRSVLEGPIKELIQKNTPATDLTAPPN